MATDKQRVLAAVDNPHVRRALDIIATTEGAGKQGYYTAFGGGRLASLADHPRQLHPFTQTNGKKNETTAAGRYQFLEGTWDDVAKKYGLNDFGERAQDIGAVELMRRAGALDAIVAGDLAGGFQKLGSTWASLPSSPYAQPKVSQSALDKLIGSTSAPAPAPATPAALTSPEIIPGATPVVGDVKAAFDALLGSAPQEANPLPPWASEVNEMQNRQEIETAIAEDDRENRGRAVAAFFDEPYVPQLRIPPAIEDSINRYLALL